MKTALALSFLIFASTAHALAGEVKEKARVRQIINEFARCTVEANPERATDIILSNFDSSGIARKYPELRTSECLYHVGGDVKVIFPADLFRYALADALVNQTLSEKPETDFSNRLPLAHHLPATKSELDVKLAKLKSARAKATLQKDYEEQIAVAWLSRYGECIVRADPVHAWRWLLTRPDGPEETSRIAELRPAFSGCLDAVILKFTRTSMRGAIAINYFRLANATPQHIAEKAR